VLLDCPGDRKFLAWARWRLGHLFPYLPKQPGYNKRIRALAPQVARLLNLLIFESTSIHDEQRHPALMRPSKVMSKAFRAAFQRLDQLPFAVAVGWFGRLSEADVGRRWGLDDVQPPSLFRLYRAAASEHYVLITGRDPELRTGVDRREPVTPA
jgi:hypothetical protein